jgi:hypothetical protein
MSLEFVFPKSLEDSATYVPGSLVLTLCCQRPKEIPRKLPLVG